MVQAQQKASDRTCAKRLLRQLLRLSVLLAALALPATAGAQARRQAQVLMSENEDERRSQEEWGYSDAVIAGDTIYLSGIVVGQREGESLEAAYDRAYRRIGAILARAGASWDDVVDMTTFHTDVTVQMPAIVAVHRRYVTAPFPAWTAIDVDRLIPDRGVTEIKIVARRVSAEAREPTQQRP
jgi:enamine deaminase RidA (YjgF/YER057c/UK114 family)